MRLTPTEWGFLEVLARNVGRLVTREQVLREVEEHLDRAVERARLAQLSDEELHTMLQTIITTSATSKDKQ